MDALLRQWPHLHAHPLPRLLTPRHCAARAGNVRALAAMLENAGGCLDATFQAEAAGHSVRITGLAAEQNDLYVHQPPLLFNGRPVYVGHATGQYLYYYEPQPDDPGTRRDPGWCLSGCLGNGDTDVRLVLPTHASEEQVRLRPETGLRTGCRRKGSFWGRLRSCIPKKKTKSGRQSEASDEAAFASSGSGVAMPPASPGPAEPGGPLAPPGPDPQRLRPDAAGLSLVPRAVSLLEAAVASGESAMVGCALEAYLTRYPQCLLRQRHVGHGLWWAYPPHVQTQIARALAQGQRSVTIRDGPAAAAARLDLPAPVPPHRAGSGAGCGRWCSTGAAGSGLPRPAWPPSRRGRGRSCWSRPARWP